MNEEKITIKRALLSVSDKTGLIPFAQSLVKAGVAIISTGGTAELLKQAGIAHTKVSDVTAFPEIMEGRVKTLHPLIHGGILGLRDAHQEIAAQHGIEWIDLVVCNLYPFAKVIREQAAFDIAVENIDIGGPAMLRAAAKNIGWVGAVVDPADYDAVIDAIQTHDFNFALRKKLSAKVYQHTAQYDAHIAAYLSEQPQQSVLPLIEQETVHFTLPRKEVLRYGENPHQQAALFKTDFGYGLADGDILQGKTLSYNNLVDAEAALQCVHGLDQPACVIVKHANPCGIAVAENITLAYERAFAADPVSAFGGIIALNRSCTAEIAQKVSEIFMEVLIAPDYTPEALTLLAKKPNLRVLRIPEWNQINTPWQFKSISGGLLIQNTDTAILQKSELHCVTKKTPDVALLDELCFAWHVVKYLKSNAIAVTKAGVSVGLGAGQVSRIDALNLALQKANTDLDGAVLASDAFFPFRDSIDVLAKTPIKAIIQPGGSIRDKEIIAACDEHGIAMVFTGMRVFNH